MPRAFTTFVAQTSDPDESFRLFEERIGNEHASGYERTAPRRNDPDRIRIEGSGLFNHHLESALEAGDLGPVEWAVVLNAMDEGIGNNAWVFDGRERIDAFEGHVLLNGLDTVAYLERFHGVLLDSAGPYAPSASYDPSLALATERPDGALAATPPEPPFEVTGDDYWVLAEAETTAPDEFEGWLVDELREADLLLDDPDALVDRPWVTDGPTTVEPEQPRERTSTRVRVRIPLAYGGITWEGLNLQFGMRDFDGPVDWVVFLYGDAAAEQVSAWMFVENEHRFVFDLALDQVEGKSGANGADVAAYFERYYGFDIDPTPAGVSTPEAVNVDLESSEPPEGYTDVLDRYDITYPSPL